MQQINLYEYLPKPTKLLLDGRSILILYGVFCSMLLLSSLFGLIGRHSDTKRLVTAKASYSLAQHRLQDIANKHPSAEVQMHAPDIAKLGYCKVHFSTYLAALSHALVPGIALTNIVISDHGATIMLKGNSLVEDQAQKYVESLKKQPIFSNASLILQDVTRTTDKETNLPYITFNIATKVSAAQ
jgi:hypothetical protein